MSDIHYFQRYTTKENAATNNTLHLFGRVYEYSPARLSALFTQMFEQDDIDLGVTFKQQLRGKSSIPDGTISQPAVHIALETKLTASIDEGQLRRHLEGLTQTGRRFLLLLTQANEPDSLLNGVKQEAIKRGVSFRHLSFARLCKLLHENVAEYELALRPIIDDYLAYCDEMGLGENKREILRVVPCGPSHPLNERHNLYFHPQDRGYTAFKFVGIYFSKSVRLIGEVAETIDAEMHDDDALSLFSTTGKPILNSVFEPSIRQCIHDARRELGWDIRRKHRFFCVPRFFPTNFIKKSPGGIMGSRNRDVSHLKAKDAEHLAQLLDGQSWE